MLIDPISENAPRFSKNKKGGHYNGGHVESYFLRANHPNEAKAFWFKATVFIPENKKEPSLKELWAIFFQKKNSFIWSAKESELLSQFNSSPLKINFKNASFLIDKDQGFLKGCISNSQGECSWDLSFKRPKTELAKPLSIFPYRKMLEMGFPKSKLLTPFPNIVFKGEIKINNKKIAVENWTGMQGHNWGKKHAAKYAWGQCNFLDEKGKVSCMVEGFSGQIKIGSRLSPVFSAIVVRRGNKEYRFDSLFDFWKQKSEQGKYFWKLSLKSNAGSCDLFMKTKEKDLAVLAYYNPDNSLSYCINSKLAEVYLVVNPINEDGFECHSLSGGALEFLEEKQNQKFLKVCGIKEGVS